MSTPNLLRIESNKERIMFLPALHDHENFHENGLQEIRINHLGINHDGGVWFVEGQVEENDIGINPQWIATPVYGKADSKASQIYFASCIHVNNVMHTPIPSSIIAIINHDLQIVDLKCSTCLGHRCSCP